MTEGTSERADAIKSMSPPWLLMLISVAVAAPLAYLLNIRFDEAYTLSTTSDGVVQAFQKAIGFGQQAPLYFVLISIWRSMEHSIFFARAFSVVCLPLFVWVAFSVSKRYLKNVDPLFVAAIAAVHQQAVWNALDIRLYALMTLFSGLLLLLFYDGYLSEKATFRARVLYIVVAVLSLYTQYYLGFQLVAGAAVLLVLGRWKVLGRYVLDMAVAGLLFIPMLMVIGGQLSNVSGQIEVPLTMPEMIREIYQRVVSLFLAVEWIPLEMVKRWGVRAVIAAIAGLFAYKVYRYRKAEDIAIGVYIAVMIGFFLVAIDLAGWSLTQTRHLSGLILPLAMIPFAALAVFRNKWITPAWAGFVLLLSVVSLVVTYSPLAKPGDFERVSDYLMQNERANEPVLVFHADAVLPLRQYYKGRNQLVALPQENGLEKWDPRNNVLRDEAQIIERINSVQGLPDRFWLVHDGWCAQGAISFNCQMLESVIEKYFVVEHTRRFYDPATVRLLRRK